MNSFRQGRVFGASVAGTSHLRADLHRQDRLHYRVLDSALVTAVCDGAGSAPRSASGAEVAAGSAVTMAVAKLRQLHESPNGKELAQLLRQSVQSARKRVEDVALRKNHPVGSYATTLLLAVQTENTVGVAQVGDGAVVISGGPDAFETFTQPQNGEYANQTNFLTSTNAMDCLEIRVDPSKPRYLAMFTDGIQNLVLKQPQNVPQLPFFANLFRWLQRQTDKAYVESELARLLRSPQVSSRTDDDLTLVVTIRR